MPIITTKILGVNEADPKPATGFNYAGEPMKPGDFYNGRPEHQGPNTPEASHTPSVKRVRKASSRVSAWTAEKRAAYGERMRQWHAARKAKSDA